MSPTNVFLLENKVKKLLLKAVEEENPPLAFFEDLLCCPLSKSKERFTKPFADVAGWKLLVNDKLTSRLHKLDAIHLQLLYEALEVNHLLLALKIIAQGRRKIKDAKTNRSELEDIYL